MNFIIDFLKKVEESKGKSKSLTPEKIVFKQKTFKEKKDEIDLDLKDKVFPSEPKKNIDKDFENDKTNEIAKELASYLDNDVELEKSLLELNKDKNNMTKDEIKIVEQEDSLNWKWIIAQFLIGVILIFVTFTYVQNNPAKQKFLESSVQLWTNTFQKILSAFGGVFSQEVDKTYLQKRSNMLSKLGDLKVNITKCLAQTSDQQKIKELNQLLNRVNAYYSELSNTQVLSLKQFINNYDQYNLYLYSLENAYKQLCNLKTKK